MGEQNIYIISCGKVDGLGSQVVSKILGMIFSHKHNFQYIYYPILKLDFRDQDESGKKAFENNTFQLWIDKWNNLLNLGENYKNINQIEIEKSIDLTDPIKEELIKESENYLLHDFGPAFYVFSLMP